MDETVQSRRWGACSYRVCGSGMLQSLDHDSRLPEKRKPEKERTAKEL